MAAQIGTSTDTLEILGAIEEKPYAFDFFSVLRHLECMHPGKPRFGEAGRPADEPVRLTQEPSLAFSPSTLASFKAGTQTAPHRLSSYFFGLFGPHGPLPLHLTEYVEDRQRNEGDPTFRRFTDIFHHRLLLLFYRAWANANPAVSLDRAPPRRFDLFVGASFGLGPELRGRDSVPDEAKLHLSGLLGLKTRPSSAIIAMLKTFFELPFEIREHVGSWMKLPDQDCSRLGARASASTLGADVVLGGAVWSCQHRFRLICGPLQFEDFKRLLPGRASLKRLRDLVRTCIGHEFEWDVNLVLNAHEVPDLRLGVSGELGWTSWLGKRGASTDADDVVVSAA